MADEIAAGSSRNPFGYLNRCLDMGEREIACAMGSNKACRELLERLATIARPKEGAGKVLLLFGRLAAERGAWLGGPLCVELIAYRDLCIVQVKTSVDGGTAEEAVPDMVFDVTLDEFVRALERAPQLVSPLSIRHRTGTRIVLASPEWSGAIPGAAEAEGPILSLDDVEWTRDA